LTSTVGDKTNFSITWLRVTSTRNVTIIFAPLYNDAVGSTDPEGPLAFHAPEDITLREFRIQPVTTYDGNISSVTIKLKAGTDTLVSHQIFEIDDDKNDPKWFQFNGGLGIILPATGRLRVEITAPDSVNSADHNEYQCQLWGQVNR